MGKRQCGSCSLCCKVLHIPELNKPVNQWCPHCRPGKGGCSIYADRPDVCRVYQCGWLSTDKLPESWYPAKSHFLVQTNDDDTVLYVHVDQGFPSAWRKEPYYAELLVMAREFLVVVEVGNNRILLRPDGTEVPSYLSKNGSLFDRAKAERPRDTKTKRAIQDIADLFNEQNRPL